MKTLMRKIARTVATIAFAAGMPLAAAAPAHAAVYNGDGITADKTVSLPGGVVRVTGEGYRPNSLVVIRIYSTPVDLLEVTTDATGAFDVEVTLPASIELGDHTIKAEGVDPDGAVLIQEVPITLTADGTIPTTGSGMTLPLIALGAASIVGGVIAVARSRRPA